VFWLRLFVEPLLERLALIWVLSRPGRSPGLPLVLESAVSASLAAARRALLSNAVAVGVAGSRSVALAFLVEGAAGKSAVAQSADMLRTLRSSYRSLRRAGCSPARLAVVARYGSFFAAIVDGQTAVEFPSRRANVVAARAIHHAFVA